MADEFMKGLGIFTGAGLAWMVLASWYRTPSFGSTEQLVAPVTVSPEAADVFNTVAISLMDVMFWFTLLGPLAFWIVIPGIRQVRETLNDRGNSN
jgi:hypothetical protein